jgi:hypothetical protein
LCIYFKSECMPTPLRKVADWDACFLEAENAAAAAAEYDQSLDECEGSPILLVMRTQIRALHVRLCENSAHITRCQLISMIDDNTVVSKVNEMNPFYIKN